MIFRLQDVYWSQEGQLSVNVVTLAAACVGLATVGVSPVDDLPPDITAFRYAAVAVLLLNFVLVAITALKGKYPTALLGLFIGPIAWVAAARLARPTSPWARWRYSAAKRTRAGRRAAAFDRRWAPVRQHWDDFIGGTPTSVDQAVADPAVADPTASDHPADQPAVDH
jgi:predicted MFS family arabinose efflux permease